MANKPGLQDRAKHLPGLIKPDKCFAANARGNQSTATFIMLLSRIQLVSATGGLMFKNT